MSDYEVNTEQCDEQGKKNRVLLQNIKSSSQSFQAFNAGTYLEALAPGS